jgi:hypothetical protein
VGWDAFFGCCPRSLGFAPNRVELRESAPGLSSLVASADMKDDRTMTLMPLARTIAISLLLLTGLAHVASAQSLAGAARQEAERRQTVKPSGKVVTNKDLPAPPRSSVVVLDVAAPTGAQAGDTEPSAGKDDASSGDKDGAGDDAKEAAKDEEKGQEYWSAKMKALQDQLRRDRTLADGMQSRINALTTDFVNRADPEQRAVVAAERDAAAEELTRLQKAIVDGAKAIADLEEEARQAGVPAGWLR